MRVQKRIRNEDVSISKGKLRIGKSIDGQNTDNPMTPVDIEEWKRILKRRRVGKRGIGSSTKVSNVEATGPGVGGPGTNPGGGGGSGGGAGGGG